MKNKETAIKLFESRQIRTAWNEQEEEWYFSVVDVIGALTDSDRPRKYWDDLKRKLKSEGSELSEKIGQLKMQSSDGKFYKTDAANTGQLFRIIQSIPSPKAEPIKLWIANIAFSQYSVICLNEQDQNLLYFSPESPDVTQWLSEAVNGKTSTAPAIGSAPQKIATVNYETLQPYGSKWNDKLRQQAKNIRKQIDATDDEDQKKALNKEAKKINDEMYKFGNNLIWAVTALAREDGYMFVVMDDDEIRKYFPNAVDITEKVLIKIILK